MVAPAVGGNDALGIAVIAEGILGRAQQDPRNRATSGAPVHQTVNDLVSLAHDIAAGAGI